jgi:hypothetical protein
MILLHVGYAKTGTTSLQRHFFPKLKNIDYFGRNPDFSSINKTKLTKWVYTKVLKNNTYLYEQFIHHLHADTDKYKPDAIEWVRRLKVSKNPAFFSSENILRPGNVKQSLLRLSELLGDEQVKIIFTIRAQEALIKSRVNHDRNFYDCNTERDFFSKEMLACSYPYCCVDNFKKCSSFCEGKRKVSLPYYDFFNIIQLFEEFFGLENIYIFPMENLFKAMPDEITKFSELTNNNSEYIKSLLLNIPKENQGDKNSYKAINQRIDKHGEMIHNYYYLSNKKLSEKYNLQLSKLYFK